MYQKLIAQAENLFPEKYIPERGGKAKTDIHV